MGAHVLRIPIGFDIVPPGQPTWTMNKSPAMRHAAINFFGGKKLIGLLIRDLRKIIKYEFKDPVVLFIYGFPCGASTSTCAVFLLYRELRIG